MIENGILGLPIGDVRLPSEQDNGFASSSAYIRVNKLAPQLEDF
jgi:hypothetical protein